MPGAGLTPKNRPKPTAHPIAEVEHYANTLDGTGFLTAAQGADGINAFEALQPDTAESPRNLYQADVVFGGIMTNNISDRRFVPGIAFAPGTGNKTGFEYAWVQVLHNVTVTNRANQGSVQILKNESPGVSHNELDNWFPYPDNGGIAVDYPCEITAPYVNELAAGYSYTMSYSFSATMWLICKPPDGSNWIPLARADWGLHFVATATGNGAPQTPLDPAFTGMVTSKWALSGGSDPGKVGFAGTSGAWDFPLWVGGALNSPSVKTIKIETRPAGSGSGEWDWFGPGVPA